MNIILKKYFCIIVLVVIAVFNSFIQIGIIEDGSHHILDAILSDNCIVGHEGFLSFPFNSRMFPTYLPHISVGLAKNFNVYDINVLSSIFTFVVYFAPIIFLLFILFNIPKNKKENFEIILSSFLVCFLFMEYHIWTENINTGLFLWILFVIYYYIDFDKLSKFNIFSVLIFSFFVISSHPMAIAFVLPFILFGAKKLFSTKNIDVARRIVIIISLCLLVCALIFNLYYLFYPIAFPDDYFKFKVFCNVQFIVFAVSICSVLVLSCFNNKLSKVLFILFSFIILCSLIFQVDSSIGYPYRTLGFYVPIVFMLFIIFKDRCNININYNYFKILNCVLVLVILCNSISIGIRWTKKTNYIKQSWQEQSSIELSKCSSMISTLHHKASLPTIFLILTHENNQNLIIDLRKYKNKEYLLLPSTVSLLKENKNKLSKFGINCDKIVVTNN